MFRLAFIRAGKEYSARLCNGSVFELLRSNKNQEDQAMKKTIQVEIKEPQYIVDTNVTFAQVRDWFGHTTKDLKMDIIFPEQGEKRSPCIIWICGGAW